MFDGSGEGFGKLKYSDVLLRTQVNLALKNATFKITIANPPLVDFSGVKIKLRKINGQSPNLSEGHNASVANELGPLLS